MKKVIIEVKDNPTAKLLLDFSKEMGLSVHVEKKRELKPYLMPDDEQVLEEMMDEAEENFKKGKYLSANEARERVEKWGTKNSQLPTIFAL